MLAFWYIVIAVVDNFHLNGYLCLAINLEQNQNVDTIEKCIGFDSVCPAVIY